MTPSLFIFDGTEVPTDVVRGAPVASVTHGLVALGVAKDLKHAQWYWNNVKRRLKQEGASDELWSKLPKLPVLTPNGRTYKRDATTLEQWARLLQSVPLPKAEPFKEELARVFVERLKEMADSASGLQRWEQRSHNNPQRLVRQD